MNTHLLLLGLLCTSLLLTPLRAAHAAPVDPATATLYGVCFVDLQQGWAVGNGGVILHTADGGKTWERQASGHELHAAAGVFRGRQKRLGGRRKVTHRS